MLNLDAFTGRDLQNFLSFLNQCETDGVTDIRFVRERIQNHISSRYQAARPSKIRGKKTIRETPSPCPSCGKAKMVSAKGVTESVLVCPACRYSEYSEVVV